MHLDSQATTAEEVIDDPRQWCHEGAAYNPFLQAAYAVPCEVSSHRPERLRQIVDDPNVTLEKGRMTKRNACGLISQGAGEKLSSRRAST